MKSRNKMMYSEMICFVKQEKLKVHFLFLLLVHFKDLNFLITQLKYHLAILCVNIQAIEAATTKINKKEYIAISVTN